VTVAVTGATGFLGLHLLRALLATHDSLVVLARGEPATVLARIAGFFTVAGEPAEFVAGLPDRIRVVRADLTQPALGLSTGAYGALADEVDGLWHCAADTTQDADLARLRLVNVGGTRNALALASAGAGRTRFFHVSTAFVAGRRRYGTVYDDEITDAYGFETPYERSKYEAEIAVRAWAAEQNRGAVVFRPSVLSTHLPPGPLVPSHPLLFASRGLRALTGERQGGRQGERRGGRPASEALVRVAGQPDSHLNVIPVEDAAAVMVALADRCGDGRVETYHVVHHAELPVTALLDALAETVPIRFAIVGEVGDPSPLEAKVQMLSGAWAYAHHHRRYDDARVRALIDVHPSRGRLDRGYLIAGIRP
jgi:nucleoside-diphosphate-sugar epimerase